LEQRWVDHGMDRPGNLVPSGDAAMAELEQVVAPLRLPEELRRLYAWCGGDGDVWLPANADHGCVVSPRSVIDHWRGPNALIANSIHATMVPVIAVDRSIGVAEIDPESATCRIWLYSVEDGSLDLLYPSMAHLFDAIGDLTPTTEQMRAAGAGVLEPTWVVGRPR
jgi:hypothetical protein